MRPQETPHDVTPPASGHSDASLRAALQALPADDAAVLALQAKVMTQWQQAHATGAHAVRQMRPILVRRQRWLWLGSAGLVAAAVVATVALVMPQDPSIDELMQPDVLSQLAIGEM